MAIFLITDFGLAGPYTGQVLARLDTETGGMPAFSLFADAPTYDARRSAYLVAAYGRQAACGDVLLCVVDPGVGTERAGLALKADDRWYVGPDNGLLQIAAGHAQEVEWWGLEPPPAAASVSFHGRDWFAPVAARIARTGEVPGARLDQAPTAGAGWPNDLSEIVYIDHYGNAMTGLRADGAPRRNVLLAGGQAVPPGRVFAEMAPGAAFWYPNSSALVEVAVNRGRAADVLGLQVGSPVAWRC